MTKVMSAFDNAMIKAQCTAMDEASKMKQDKTSKFARIAITAIEGQIASGMGSVYGVLKTIAIPIAAVALGFAAYQIFAGGEKGMEKAKKTILYTAIGIAIVFLAPTIINQISGWFSNSGDAGVFSA